MKKKIILLSIICLTLFCLDLILGSISIPLQKLFDTEYQPILWQIRLPKALTAVCVGSALSVAGLMMQTLFRNPRAGPYVLGISSGAALGVSIFILLFSILGISISGLFIHWGVLLFALAGASLLFLVLLVISQRVNDSVTLLVAGMMIGSVASAIISILQHISDAHYVKYYINWTLGSLSNVTLSQIGIIGPLFVIVFLFAIILLKPMDVLLISESYAQSVGVNLRQVRMRIMVATVLLVGLSTALAGPIGFVGIAVPHVARSITKRSTHRVLFPVCLLSGASMMLLCDLLSQIPPHGYVLPINAVTALMGIPIILWIILGKNKMVI